MNIRTLVILTIGIFILLYLINKKIYRIDSVCYDDEDVSSVVASKGLLGKNKVALKTGESKNGYSLIKNDNGQTVLTLPNGKKKKFEKYSYYAANNTSPIG